MIAFTQFSSIFRDTDFNTEELRKFYHSVKKSVILKYVGRRSWPELFRLEEKCQWPVLRLIDDPELPIYRDADPELLKHFISNIKEEKSLRERKSLLEKVEYWSALQSIIAVRIDLFTQIFNFCKKDAKYCQTIAERYIRIMEQRKQQRKKMWQVGIGTGAATLAGAAALWYISQRDKK